MDLILGEREFGFLLSALRFAAIKHSDQRRKNATKEPYINHPIKVVEILWAVGGVREINTLVAALLHDTIEDTRTTPEEIRDHFGEDVLSLVLEVTDDKTQPKAERKRLQVQNAPHKSSRARQIKLADKICNVEDITYTPPVDWPRERRREYLDWTEQVISGLRGLHPALEARYDAALAEGRRVLNQDNGQNPTLTTEN